MIVEPKIPIKSRIAPTPSGFLHLGNLMNFLFVYLVTRALNGTIRLRIDDIDNVRFRKEYLVDIFNKLEWLGITWDEGPFSIDEVNRHSQHKRIDDYLSAIDLLWANNYLFVCNCSRLQLSLTDNHACRQALSLRSNFSGLRLKGFLGEISWFDFFRKEVINVPESSQLLEPIMLRKNNGLPSYQLVSVVDDLLDGINVIVRGDDLIQSTACQIQIAHAINQPSFSKIKFFHHNLIHDEIGTKLSKSAGNFKINHFKDAYTPSFVYQFFANWLGLPFFKEIQTIEELYEVFNEYYPLFDDFTWP